MASAAVEKGEDELRKELEELNRQQREITERLRDPRGIRRGGLSGPGPRNFAPNGGAPGGGPRNFAANGGRQRGFVRPADRNDKEDQPPAKRRLSSAVVKIEDGEIIDDDSEVVKDVKVKDIAVEVSSGNANAGEAERKPSNWSRRDGNQRPSRTDFDIPTENVPRVLPKNEDPSLVSRNKRILGQLQGVGTSRGVGSSRPSSTQPGSGNPVLDAILAAEQRIMASVLDAILAAEQRIIRAYMKSEEFRLSSSRSHSRSRRRARSI